MKKYRLLCQDIIEYTSETLSKDMAIRVLLDQLRDLGWQDGSKPANTSTMSNTLTVSSEEQKMPQAMLSPNRGRAAIPLDMMNELQERADEV